MSYSIHDTTEHFFNRAFARNGVWEANMGREQTRGFAECFVKNIQIPLTNFSFLDMGCALGDSMPVLKKAYPDAKLCGCDISSTAIERCNEEYGDIADFFQAGFEDLAGCVDIILCSNVLEHFDSYKEIASILIKKCKTLYVLTPYWELKNGEPLSCSSSPAGGHITTLYKHSFDDLYINNEIAAPVKTKIVRAPNAWSPALPREVWNEIRRPFKMLYKGGYLPPKGRQIIYEFIGSKAG